MNAEQNKEAFLEFIRIPSITGSEGEEKACAFLEEILNEHGISSERIAKTPERPNLLAVIRAAHPEKEPLVLISHIDVVDGDEEKWTHPVFGAERAEGRIWGRGTLDTKHLTMMELYSFLQLRGREEELNRDVWFLATVDEEKGSEYGMAYVKTVRPELFSHAVVINEGGGFPLHINGKNYMMLTVGEKAVCKVKIKAEGTGGHASAPGDNQAIQKLSKGLFHIFSAEKELTCGSRRTYETMKQITGSEEWDNPVGADIFGYAGQNSIGMRGYQIGERSNVIPAKAETTLEFKVLPETMEEDIRTFLEKHLKGDEVSFEILGFEPGFESSFENSRLRDLCGSRRTYETMKQITGSEEWDNPVGADIFGYAGQNSIGMRGYQIGERSNVIPAKAETTLEFKVLPETMEEDIRTFLEKHLKGDEVSFEILGFEPGFESSFENSRLRDLTDSLQDACRRHGLDCEVLPMLALGRTDGRFFGSEGSMVYGCSPLLMGDSFDVVLPKVHGNDESILEESYEFGVNVLYDIISRICFCENK